MMKSYKHWGIFSKIVSLSLLSWVVLVLATLFALVPYIQGLLMDEKKDTVRFLVEEASTILASYQKQVEAGALQGGRPETGGCRHQAATLRRQGILLYQQSGESPGSSSPAPGKRGQGHELLQGRRR